jgi:hypothetical protein
MTTGLRRRYSLADVRALLQESVDPPLGEGPLPDLVSRSRRRQIWPLHSRICRCRPIRHPDLAPSLRQGEGGVSPR